jgi:regulator of sigma E protease
MTDFLQTAAAFVLVLGIVVFVHEFGHFVVAKAFGIGVTVFSFGIGPRLFGRTLGGTDVRVSAIPLGGYVRLAGDEEDAARTGAAHEFLSRPRGQRFLVYVAGGLFNIGLAVGAAWLMFWLYGKHELALPERYPVVAEVVAGSPADRAGIRRGDRILAIAGRDARDIRVQVEETTLSPGTRKTIRIEREGREIELELDTGRDPRYHLGDPGWLLRQDVPESPVVQRVYPATPAEAAGLRPGDVVVGVEGKEPISEVELRAVLTASAGRELVLKIERNGERLELPIRPRDEGGQGRIGVTFRTPGLVHRQLGWVEAGAESIRLNIEVTRNVFLTLRKLLRGEISVRAFSGPIEIARVSWQAVQGFESFLGFLALISLQLGILNLLPIPVLDGGHILILATEAVFRRDLSVKVKERVIQAGFVFLLAFFAVVIYFDVIKTWFS